ncbi:MAG: xylulose kinase [Deltaproteobacteria bacterium]|nr:xylulose kinase [Deltaproteobacteria bacterium]MBT6616448.1 xylulose kinase [Deltaproteobacteria bacterium]MBT7715552.1 xylulose kinase [Deltaproteobacteria bacterium]
MSSSDDRYILSIDLGTSGSKTALTTIYGDVIDFEFEAVPLHLKPGGAAEQNPDDWWSAIMNTSKKLISKNQVPPESIIAICSSTQWAGTVPLDKDGNHLMNAVIWMDSRGERHVKDLIKGPIKIEGYDIRKLLKWIRLTGGAPGTSGKDPVGHIHLIKNEFNDVYQKTHVFLEPKDYINYRFTGKFAASYDSITCHWVTDNRDLSKVDYHKGLLKMTGLEREKLPDLKQSIDILGPIKKEVAAELGLREDVQVVMGTPDLMAAALGSGAVGDGEGHIYIGTSSWVAAHVPFKKTDLFHGMASLPCAVPGRYLLVNEQETAGGTLTFLRDNILYHKDELLMEEAVPDLYKIFDRIAAKVPPGSNKVIFTPWLNGERTPVEDNTIRAGVHNLSLKSTREDIIRAVMEGVAFNQRWVLKYVEKFVGHKMPYLHIVGGGASSDIWCQIHADVLQRDIKQVSDPIQANARGTAYIAAVGMGLMKFEDIPKHLKIKEVYKPNPDNRKIYDELFAAYIDIYNNNKKMYARLNQDL